MSAMQALYAYIAGIASRFASVSGFRVAGFQVTESRQSGTKCRRIV